MYIIQLVDVWGIPGHTMYYCDETKFVHLAVLAKLFHTEEECKCILDDADQFCGIYHAKKMEIVKIN